MTNFNMITEMVKTDGYLYQVICDVVGDKVSTADVYKIFGEISQQKTWTIADIERLANALT